MADPMGDSAEASAMWGLAENQAFPVDQRLKCALKALEFFGNAYHEMEEDNDDDQVHSTPS